MPQPGRNPGLTPAASGAVLEASVGHVTVTSGGWSTRGGGRRQRGRQGPPAAVPEALTVAQQLTWHRGEVERLEQQQRAELVAAIAATIPPGVVFSSADVWQHQAVNPALRQALEDLGITSPKQLGKRLRHLCHTVPCGTGGMLRRVDEERAGVLWVVE